MEWQVSSCSQIIEYENGEEHPRIVATVNRKKDMPIVAAAPEMHKLLNEICEECKHDFGHDSLGKNAVLPCNDPDLGQCDIGRVLQKARKAK